MSRKFNLATLVQTQFSEASREEMDKAYEIKKGHASPMIDDEALRIALVAMYQPEEESGAVATTLPPSHGDPVQKQRVGANRIPNLRPTGPWEGRKRRVTLLKPDEHTRSGAKRIGWEGVLWTIKYDEPVDMPWPYWQALLNTDFLDDRSEKVTKWDHDEEGRLTCERTSRKMVTIPRIDHGDVPGTEHLPVDYSDYFRREAIRTHCFRGYSKSALMTIHNMLIEPRGKTSTGQPVQFDTVYFQHMTDVDIRIAISKPLGPEISSIMDDESFALAEAG